MQSLVREEHCKSSVSLRGECVLFPKKNMALIICTSLLSLQKPICHFPQTQKLRKKNVKIIHSWIIEDENKVQKVQQGNYFYKIKNNICSTLFASLVSYCHLTSFSWIVHEMKVMTTNAMILVLHPTNRIRVQLKTQRIT